MTKFTLALSLFSTLTAAFDVATNIDANIAAPLPVVAVAKNSKSNANTPGYLSFNLERKVGNIKNRRSDKRELFNPLRNDISGYSIPRELSLLSASRIKLII
jgi:hypothetical protein